MKHTLLDIFSVKPRVQGVSQGSILVAEPFLEDLCFRRAVITIADYSEDNVVGIALNVKSTFTLGEIFPRLKRGRNIEVYGGGPVALDRVYFVHVLGDRFVPGAVSIGNGLWVGGDFDKVLEYIEDGVDLSGLVRFFVGYTGWTSRQLDDEIEQSVWGVINHPISGNEILSTPHPRLWHRMVSELGSAYRVWSLHPTNVTDN